MPPQLLREVPLAPLTSFGTGGNAQHFAPIDSVANLVEGLNFAESAKLPWWLLGGGSNVLIADAGLPGVVLQWRNREIAVLRRTNDLTFVKVAAGTHWEEFVQWSVNQGLHGIECLSGIPGQVGAAPIQNIGAYGQEVAQTIDAVNVLVLESRAEIRLTNVQCEFSYRDSGFKRQPQHQIVTSVEFALLNHGLPCTTYAQVRERANAAAPSLANVREIVLQLRREKSMLLDPSDPNSRSAGSFFTNPVVDAAFAQAVLESAAPTAPIWPAGDGRVKLSAAWLIENSGMAKGYGQGTVGLSANHTLAIVNRGGATTREILAFAAHVSERVKATFGVQLQREPVYLRSALDIR